MPEPVQRRVKVYGIEIADFRLPALTLEIECGKGTYIRSIAHDLGQKLACGAHLASLTRTRFGPFDLSSACTTDELRESFENVDWGKVVYHPDVVIGSWRAAIIDEGNERRLRNGQELNLNAPASSENELCRAYSADGRFLGVLRRGDSEGWWAPNKVFLSLDQT